MLGQTNPNHSTDPTRFEHMIEGGMWLVLALNGLGFLLTHETNPLQIALIAAVGLLAVGVFLKVKFFIGQYLVKSFVMAGIIGYLLLSSGGIDSQFEQWLFVVSAIFPTIADKKSAVLLPVLLSIVYLSLAPISGLSMWSFAVLDKVFLIILISWIIFALTNNLRKSIHMLQVAYDATIEGWAMALELRDDVTKNHTQRVTNESLALAKNFEIDADALQNIRWGALLHDIGKIGIPDNILKKPGKLTNEEFEIMKQHPVLAREMLLNIDFLAGAIDIPYCHHERWDGSGYPNGLSADEIPLPARIFSVIDVWDALTSERPYRQPWEDGKVLDYLKERAGSEFDPMVVEKFIQMKKDNNSAMYR